MRCPGVQWAAFLPGLRDAGGHGLEWPEAGDHRHGAGHRQACPADARAPRCRPDPAGAGPRPPQFPSFETNNAAPTFDGSSAYVNGPYQLVNNLPAFSVGGWICPTAAQNNRTGLFGQNDTMEFGFSDSSHIQIWTPYGAVTVNYPFANNTWHYILAVGGNGQISLYLDGALAGSTCM